MRRLAIFFSTTVLALSACGGSSDDDSTADTAANEPAAADTVGTASPNTDDVLDEPDDTGSINANLTEWAIEVPAEIPSGAVTFNVTNAGDFPHQFAIARGDSYETLPLFEDGSVDESSLGADFLGRTDNVESGGATTIDFVLEPGNYVFFCNISGSVSHAAKGQVLSVTIS